MNDTKPVVLSCVEHVLTDFLGPEGKAAIEYHLKRLGADLQESFDKPAEFARVIEAVFGPGGRIMENTMVSCIASRVNVRPGETGNFTDFVTNLRAAH